MKVQLQKTVYIPASSKLFTCVGCVFVSDNGGLCEAPDSIYEYCFKCDQLFYQSQKYFKIFDL